MAKTLKIKNPMLIKIWIMKWTLKSRLTWTPQIIASSGLKIQSTHFTLKGVAL
jgi:hypothetical protein